MATYKAPLREISFILADVLKFGQLAEQIPQFADATPDTLLALVEEAAKLVEGVIAPLNHPGDLQGAGWSAGEVSLPSGLAEAYKLYAGGGWMSLSNPPEYGGQGLPYLLAKVVEEMVCSANVAFALYPGLTTGCFEAIYASSDDALRSIYLPKLSTGEWTGTMCITEASAGSDVGATRTRATLNDDGSYSIKGGKIFISSGEHTMSDNIVHFVLARLPDSPPGVKGLSTFVVPKFLINPDGSIGDRNKLHCVAIEHKMGIHASCTCQMQFDGAKGWMAGRPNEGIQNMFVMMNLSRIMVAFQGLGQCELAAQNAIAYAKDRRQGRAANGKSEIIEHPDVRRMLLTMKATTEGARVMAYETAMFVDIAQHHPDEAARAEAQDWVDLNTPLIKAFCTDSAFELGSLAVQVYGGHGFVRDHGIEQIVRDTKILCLYEGTNGIQALDLVRRKLSMRDGRLAQLFFSRVRAEIRSNTSLAFLIRPLQKALEALEAATTWLLDQGRRSPHSASFGAVDYLRAFSLVYLGYNWLRMCKAACLSGDPVLRETKLVTAEFFAMRMLPHAITLCDTVTGPVEAFMKLDAAIF